MQLVSVVNAGQGLALDLGGPMAESLTSTGEDAYCVMMGTLVRRLNRRGVVKKESHSERLAIHTGPESCGVVREGNVEALTGERAGRVFSRETITVTKTMLPVLENGGAIGCSRLTRMADVVNALMRLCVVALGNEEAEHAKTVIETHGMIAAREQSLHHWLKSIILVLRQRQRWDRWLRKVFWKWLSNSTTWRSRSCSGLRVRVLRGRHWRTQTPANSAAQNQPQPLPSADDSYVRSRV